MIIRERNMEKSVEYEYDNGTRISKTEIYNNMDYNKAVDKIEEIRGISLIDYMVEVEDTKGIEELLVEFLRDNLKILSCDGYIALMLCFKPFDLNLLKSYSLDEMLNRKVSRRDYRGIVSRLLNVDLYEDFHNYIDKNSAITLVEAVHYIVNEFGNYVENSEVVDIVTSCYQVDRDIQIILQNEEDTETLLDKYVEGTITGYNNGVLYADIPIIYPYLKAMAEVIYQELVTEYFITDDIAEDMLHEVTYRELFYLIYRLLVFRPEQ